LHTPVPVTPLILQIVIHSPLLRRPTICAPTQSARFTTLQNTLPRPFNHLPIFRGRYTTCPCYTGSRRAPYRATPPHPDRRDAAATVLISAECVTTKSVPLATPTNPAAYNRLTKCANLREMCHSPLQVQ
jgi:hypothetical protein